MNWYHFDYLIYQYYLILKHSFTIVNTTPITGIEWSLEKLETTDLAVLQKLLDIGCGFGWCNHRLYKENQAFLNAQGTFLLFHLDRNLT
jgi:hypothetical protein